LDFLPELDFRSLRLCGGLFWPVIVSIFNSSMRVDYPYTFDEYALPRANALQVDVLCTIELQHLDHRFLDWRALNAGMQNDPRSKLVNRPRITPDSSPRIMPERNPENNPWMSPEKNPQKMPSISPSCHRVCHKVNLKGA